MTTQPRCASCGGYDLAHEVEIFAHQGVNANLKKREAGWLDRPQPFKLVGRLCFDCGHVALYVSEKDRATLYHRRDAFKRHPAEGAP